MTMFLLNGQLILDTTLIQTTQVIGYCFGGVSGYETCYYLSDWHSVGNDWCVCVLESDLGNLTNSWLGSQAYGTNGEMDGLSVRALGYPIIPGFGNKQMYTEGNLSWVTSTKFDTSSAISRGMSGGPIVRTSDDTAVGVCAGFYTFRPSTGIGARITQQVIDTLLALWPN